MEAWFRNSEPETVLELFCCALTGAGFIRVGTPTLHTSSWDCLTLDQHKVFVGFTSRTEDHLVVEIRARTDWNTEYPAFEKVFINLLNNCQNIQLAELLLSARNPEPTSFSTHSFMRGSFPLTIVNLDENKTAQRGADNYWSEWGPELHFIANEVFERTQVDVTSFASSLAAEIIPLQGGSLLDCGWTKEFELPKHIAPI
jgi:hypothetical protein